MDHGSVVEAGGLHTQNGSAVEELNKIDIVHRAVVNPETKEEEQRIFQGFFHHHWNAANDIKAFHDLSGGKLAERVCELRDDLHLARTELGRRNASKLLPPLLLGRAVSHPVGSCQLYQVSDHKSESPVNRDNCITPIDISGKTDPITQGIMASMVCPLMLSRAVTCPAA